MSWYQDIYKSIEKYYKLRVPIELVHFPSVGVTSTLSRIAIETENQSKEPKLIVIDFRTGLFKKDQDANKKEFLRILKSHIEQYFGVAKEDKANIYKQLEENLRNIVKEGRDAVLVLFTSGQFDVASIPEFRDLLVFIESLRTQSNGAINVLISTTYPIFHESNPSPIPLISRYYNYYDKQWLNDAITEAIFNGKAKPEIVDTVLRLTGGMASLAKYIRNDLDYYFLKPDALLNYSLNAKFFEDFMYTKVGIDRMSKQLHPKIKNSLIKSLNNEKLTKEEHRELDEYLVKTGFADNNGDIRSNLVKAYFSKDIPEEAINNINDISNEYQCSNYIQINDHIKIDKSSGEIYFGTQKSPDFLSEQELDFIKTLDLNRGQKTHREQIAKEIWPDHNSGFYSNWAIDKVASRVRSKINDDKPHKFIKTVRGFGFKLL